MNSKFEGAKVNMHDIYVICSQMNILTFFLLLLNEDNELAESYPI